MQGRDMMNIADSTDETQLAEIISPESAKTINIELKVAHSNIIPQLGFA